MRHGNNGYKLGRTTAHRTAMLRNLAVALFQHSQITTTEQRAKAVQPLGEKIITHAKKGDLASRRRVIAALGHDHPQIFVVKGGRELENIAEKTIVQKIFDEVGPSFRDRAGGYTRVIHLANTHRINKNKLFNIAKSGYRLGDGGDLVVLQLVGSEEKSAPKVKGKFSRRRQQQDNRTAFAAKLRKAGKEPTEAPKA